jgi:histidyl-tRNA synthetase
MEEKLQMLKEEKLKQEQAKATKQIVKRTDKQQRSSVINDDATAESARLLAMQKKLAKLKARQALKGQPPVLLPEA